MEMGFEEKEVIDALRVSNNQQSAAVSAGRLSRAPTAGAGGHSAGEIMESVVQIV